MSEDVVIIGGGLAGLTSSLRLVRAGIKVTLIEKKAYPFHKVCGEYISNEVLPFLQTLGVNVNTLGPARIDNLLLSSPNGKTLQAKLDLGGFGISRYAFDHHLYQLAKEQGVNFILQQQVLNVTFADDTFTVDLSGGDSLQAKVILGAYGKRANLDRELNRRFFKDRSPYIGVKYHIKYDFPDDLIALHNFKDGYAGISAIEGNRYCFCYLTTRQNLKQHGSISAMEQAVLYQNPHLRHIFEIAEFLYDQPEVINEISFATKTCIEDHILMCGDAAGMVAPLCGNGMAMAIHSGKIAAEEIIKYFQNGTNRQELEQSYTHAWKSRFSKRLTVGRTVQQLFGKPFMSEIVIGMLKYLPPATRYIMRRTHGNFF